LIWIFLGSNWTRLTSHSWGEKRKKDNKWIGNITCYKKIWNNEGGLVGQQEKIDVNSQHNVQNGITRENCYQFQMQIIQFLKKD
jgi:hypothetical protein